MKPLLILPPAADRWPLLRDLPIHDERVWREDFEKRFAEGLPGGEDAFAIIPDGGLVLACGGICKRHDLGVLNRLFVRPEHRGQGLARAALDSLLSWFEMTGGKWLYATTTADLAEGCLAKFGFQTIRRTPQTPRDAVVVLRTFKDVPADPLSTANGAFSIHDVNRANWPTLATLLYNRPGFDPRLALDESAVVAETTSLEFLVRQEENACHVKAAFHGARLVGLATVATDTSGERTYATVMPHTDAPPQLREAIVECAHSHGYKHVDFPMETLPGAEPAPQTVPDEVGQTPATDSEPADGG